MATRAIYSCFGPCWDLFRKEVLYYIYKRYNYILYKKKKKGDKGEGWRREGGERGPLYLVRRSTLDPDSPTKASSEFHVTSAQFQTVTSVGTRPKHPRVLLAAVEMLGNGHERRVTEYNPRAPLTEILSW